MKKVIYGAIVCGIGLGAVAYYYQEDRREMENFCRASSAELDQSELTVADTLAIVKAKAAEPDPSLSPEQRSQMLRFIAAEKQTIKQERHDACYSSSLYRAKAAIQEDFAKDMSNMKEMAAYLHEGGPMTPAQQLSFERAYKK